MDHRVKLGGDEERRETKRWENDSMMPNPRNNKPPKQPNFLKRRTFAEGKAQVDAAHVATWRLYCEALKFWRRCPSAVCQRHRRCAGEPAGCLIRGLPSVPPAERLKAEQEVIAGGPRGIAPASHIEWTVRRGALATLTSWKLG
jgi:hypothetical protein